MAFKARSSQEEVVTTFSKKTGPIKVNVLAINPNLMELTSLGFNFKNDPVYLTTKEDGTITVRIDFYVGNEKAKFKDKISIFVENKERAESKNGNFEFINKHGQTIYATTIEEAINKESKSGHKWFLNKDVRRAYNGETDFYAFIINWANTKVEEDEVMLDMNKIFKGDFSELKGLVSIMNGFNPPNELWVMATINDKGYQNIYNRSIRDTTARATISKNSFVNSFFKYTEDQRKAGYPVKDVWSTEFQNYEPKVVIPDNDTPEVEEEVTF